MAKTLKIKHIHREIFRYIAMGTPVQFIKYNTKLKPANLYKKLHTLEKNGYLSIKKVGKILDVELQPPAIKELTMISARPQKEEHIRLHDVWISCPLLRVPPGWDYKFVEKILEEKSIAYTRHHPNNWEGRYFDYSSVKVRVTPRKVLFNPPAIEIDKHDDPERAKNLILKYLEDVAPRIENLFNIKISKPRKVSMTVSSQHIAFVQNAIARYFVDNKIDLRVYDDTGKCRIIVDKSFGPELEMIDKAHAEEDAEKVGELLLDTVTGEFRPREMTKNLGKASELLVKVAQNQEFSSKELATYGREIAAHIQAVRALSYNVDQLTKRIMEMKLFRPARRIKGSRETNLWRYLPLKKLTDKDND